MTSEKFLNRFKCLGLIGLFTFAPQQGAYAQSQGYTPPPMFEDMTQPMVRPQTDNGYIVKPKVSQTPNVPNDKALGFKPPVVKPRVSVDPDNAQIRPASAPIPVPPVKPVVPSTPSPKPMAKPAPPAAYVPSVTPPRDPAVSAITGPKTMPALPAQKVDEQVLFEPAQGDQNSNEPTLFDRQQERAQKEPEKDFQPIVPRPKDNVTPIDFEKGAQGALKKIYTFEPGQISMDHVETDELAAGVVKQLDNPEHKDWRVQIKSFATPYGEGLSSDRRIALSRALSLRSSLIAQGVPALRIDVLAQGLEAQSDKPGDRIDLYLYGPQPK